MLHVPHLDCWIQGKGEIHCNNPSILWSGGCIQYLTILANKGLVSNFFYLLSYPICHYLRMHVFLSCGHSNVLNNQKSCVVCTWKTKVHGKDEWKSGLTNDKGHIRSKKQVQIKEGKISRGYKDNGHWYIQIQVD